MSQLVCFGRLVFIAPLTFRLVTHVKSAILVLVIIARCTLRDAVEDGVIGVSLHMLLEILRTLEGLATELTSMRLQGHMDSYVRSYVIALDNLTDFQSQHNSSKTVSCHETVVQKRIKRLRNVHTHYNLPTHTGDLNCWSTSCRCACHKRFLTVSMYLFSFGSSQLSLLERHNCCEQGRHTGPWQS